MTIFTAIMSGTLVAILGLISKEFLSFFVFERVRDFENLKLRAIYALNHYANVYFEEKIESSGPRVEKAQEEYRILGCELIAIKQRRNIFLGIFGVPSVKDIYEIGRAFIGLANSLGSGTDDRKSRGIYREKINSILKIE